MKKTDSTPATPESVWEGFRKLNDLLDKQSADFDHRMKEAEATREKAAADFDHRMKEAETTREKVAADFDRRMKEAEATREKAAADFDHRMKEAEATREKAAADFDHRMKKQEELVGSWGNNFGSFAEEYFFNSFEQGKQNFFGEEFDEIEKNLKGLAARDEYDIVLLNGKSVAIVEVKFKAHDRDIPKVIKKAETFRANYPDYAHHKIYLGLAAMSFYPKLEEECENEGIAVIKQTGDKVIINHTHLKVW